MVQVQSTWVSALRPESTKVCSRNIFEAKESDYQKAQKKDLPFAEISVARGDFRAR